MALTIVLYWMLMAGSWRPHVIGAEMKKHPAAFVLITILLALEFLTRRYWF